MEEKMRELGVKFSCVSLVPKSRPICAKSLSIKLPKHQGCQEYTRQALHNSPMCSRHYEPDEDESCGCSIIERDVPKSECSMSFDERYAPDDENFEGNNGPKILKNQYKTSRLTSEPGYHRYQTERKKNSRRECANKHRRNILRTQLSHLLSEIKPTLENCIPDSTDTKPEPEILAEVLLMSELEGADLSSLSPDNIFSKVFAESCDRPSYSSIDKTKETTSTIKSDEKNTDTIFSNEEDDSTEYKILPHLAENKTDYLEPLGRSTPQELSSEDLNSKQRTAVKKNVRHSEEFEFTRVQINGSAKPAWFPGYVIISPVEQSYIRITANPEAVLSKIWRLCRPKSIQPTLKFTVT